MLNAPIARLGVDFGSSHTIAVLANGNGPATPLLFDGSPVLPSSVAVDSTGDLLTGRDAVTAARLDPGRFEPSPKRRVDDGSILLGDKEFPVIDVIAAVLRRVRIEADRVATGAIGQVTLTHPAAWGPRRRLILEDAATAAGFTDPVFTPEPTAAAAYFSHILGHDIPDGHGVVVFDLGGGTFDASVVASRNKTVEVLAVDGLDNLGGIDIDHALTVHLGTRFESDPLWTRLVSPATPPDRRARRLLADDVRAAKESLSRHASAEFLIPLLDTASHLTRNELETLTRPLLEQAIDVTRAVIRASRLPAEHVNGVFLVGGASRMPLAATMLHHALGTAPVVTEHPELVVAQGAVAAAAPAAPSMVEPAPVPVPAAVPAPAPSVPAKPVPSAPPPVPAWKPRPRVQWPTTEQETDSKRGPVGAAESQSGMGPWAGIIVFFIALVVFTVLIVALTS